MRLYIHLCWVKTILHLFTSKSRDLSNFFTIRPLWACSSLFLPLLLTELDLILNLPHYHILFGFAVSLFQAKNLGWCDKSRNTVVLTKPTQTLRKRDRNVALKPLPCSMRCRKQIPTMALISSCSLFTPFPYVRACKESNTSITFYHKGAHELVDAPRAS